LIAVQPNNFIPNASIIVFFFLFLADTCFTSLQNALDASTLLPRLHTSIFSLQFTANDMKVLSRSGKGAIHMQAKDAYPIAERAQSAPPTAEAVMFLATLPKPMVARGK
jgi:hypothetical protein